MCGITGFISNDSEFPADAMGALLERMCSVITHRGPDDQGTLVRGRAALGMRRLSIIDVKTGQQPIFNTSGELAIVFNGEIYNYQDIRRELRALGHQFKTNSDTEVIVHAYEEFGEDCLKKLRGMFAFAIWNFRTESLFIARDRIGKKPLFYAITKGGDFVFGSELKTLLEHPGISREIDINALDAYLSFGYVPEERCIFKGVWKLLPGHFLTFRRGRLQTQKYWDVFPARASGERSDHEWAAELRDKIREAVRIRLVSEVPLGAFLSGGLDSSTVVAMMAEVSSGPVKTFSIGFKEDTFDELRYSRIAARHLGTEHHEFVVTPDLFDLIGKIGHHFDEPFADQSALPTFLLARLARDHVTVVLSGDGGDELFAGYTRYATDRSRSRFEAVPKLLRRDILGLASRYLPRSAPGKNYLHNISLDRLDRYIDSVSTFNGPRKRTLYSPDFAVSLIESASEAEELFRNHGDMLPASDPLARLLYLDTKTYLPGDILTKVDRMTMANSLEARVPLLDHEVVELAAAMPSRLKLNGRGAKYILKRAMADSVPAPILNRPKQGFGVPIAEWINDQLRDRINADLADRRTRERGYFEGSYIDALLSEHGRGRRDNSDALWMLWMLELWFRRYIDG